MRLTKELEKRIKESLDKKYQEEFGNLYMLSESLNDKVRDTVADEVMAVVEENAILRCFIANQLYREEKSFRDRIKESVFSRCNETYELESYEELQVVRANIKALTKKKEREMEDLKIMISYSKDIKDIKKLFEDSELEF